MARSHIIIILNIGVFKILLQSDLNVTPQYSAISVVALSGDENA